MDGRPRTSTSLGFSLPVLHVLLAAVVFVGCSERELGLPRIQIEQASPDGNRVAYVRNHPSIDPPSQSLWVRSEKGRTKVLRLAEDVAWCDTIVWSGDGSRVGFLVQNAWLVVADGATGELLWKGWLVDEEARRPYPPNEKITELTLSDDGFEASFERCPRRGPGSCDVLDRVRLQ